MADRAGNGWERPPVAVTALAPSTSRPVLVERDDTTGVDVYRIAGAAPGPHVVVLAAERINALVPTAHSLVEAGFALRRGHLSIVSIVRMPADAVPDSPFARVMRDADVVIDLHRPAPGTDGVAARRATVAGTLTDLEMLEAPADRIGHEPAQLAAAHTGWFVDLCVPGTRVAAGDLIGAVADRSGAVLQRIEAPHDGMVVLIRRGSWVEAGDRLVMLTGGSGC